MSLTADVPDVVKLDFGSPAYLASATAIINYTTVTLVDPCREMNRRLANRAAKRLRRKRERRAGR